VSEQVGSDVVGSADSRVALDPRTDPEVLAGIAQARPELRVFVAMNPSAYPGLVQWLARLGDPAVDAALAARDPVPAEPSAVPSPAPPASSGSLSAPVAPVAVGHQRRRGVLIAVVLVGVLVLAGGGFAGYRLLTGGTRTSAPLEIRTQLILTPVVSGNEQITTETIAEAMRIIRARLDSSGVSGSEITSQGGSNIVVVVPGKPAQATLDLVRKRGVMRFRVVLVTGSAAPIPVPTPTGTATSKPSTTGQATTAPKSGFPPALAAATTSAPAATPMTAGQPVNASDPAWVTPQLLAEVVALNCASPKMVEAIVDDPAKPMVTCSSDGTEKFILGPAEVNGDQIANATSDQQTTQNGSSNGVWEVVLNFDSAGSKAFCDVTSRLASLPSPRNQFGIVLDNQVISAPVSEASLCANTASITGSFTSASAKALAKQLSLGALPLTLQVQSQEQVFGTLSPK